MRLPRPEGKPTQEWRDQCLAIIEEHLTSTHAENRENLRQCLLALVRLMRSDT